VSPAVPPRPKGPLVALVAACVLLVASGLSLDWELGWLADGQARSRAFERLGSFFGSFGAPDLSPEYLAQATGIALETLAVALLGTAFGVIVGYLLALGAARSVLVGREPVPRGAGVTGHRLRSLLCEACRVALDVLRGVPDFAWAILILTLPGPGPVTGMLAIGLNVAGILGKMYSETWDAIAEERYEAVRTAGSGRLATLLYGIQPLAARSMLSFTLMRTECAIRNASVIGVVSRGGLGAALFDEFSFGNYDKTVTLLLFTIALTATADLLSNFLRYQLRSDPNHPRVARGITFRASMLRRGVGIGAIVATLAASAVYLRDAFARAADELRRIEWDWISTEFGKFLLPDFSGGTLAEALGGSVFPLAIAVIGTTGAVAIAGLLAYPASVAFQLEPDRFTGERVPRVLRGLRLLVLLGARGVALVFRAVPEVAWILIAATFFRLGVMAGLIGVVLHSAGVLARVFTESVDNVPYRHYEGTFTGSRARTFLYGALPAARADWSTYSFFQFESNVRAGVVLGVIGIGGLGDSFHSSFVHWSLHRASTFLVAMILLTVLIDRLSRRLAASR